MLPSPELSDPHGGCCGPLPIKKVTQTRRRAKVNKRDVKFGVRLAMGRKACLAKARDSLKEKRRQLHDDAKRELEQRRHRTVTKVWNEGVPQTCL